MENALVHFYFGNITRLKFILGFVSENATDEIKFEPKMELGTNFLFNSLTRHPSMYDGRSSQTELRNDNQNDKNGTYRYENTSNENSEQMSPSDVSENENDNEPESIVNKTLEIQENDVSENNEDQFFENGSSEKSNANVDNTDKGNDSEHIQTYWSTEKPQTCEMMKTAV